MEMTVDERDCAQAAIEQMTTSIVALSRALMLDNNKYPNVVLTYIEKAKSSSNNAVEWLRKI